MPACSATNLPRVDDVLATLQVSSHKCKVMYYTEVLGSEDFRLVTLSLCVFVCTCVVKYETIHCSHFTCVKCVHLCPYFDVSGMFTMMLDSFDLTHFSYMTAHFSLLLSLSFPPLQPTS